MDTNFKVALVIGHSKASQGAVNDTTNVTEFNFNERLVAAIETELRNEPDISIKVIYRKTYKTLPNAINKVKPDIILSFHSNAFNGKVSGTETLFYYKSKKGKALAEVMQQSLLAALQLPDRGIKPKHTDSRGGYLLRYTDAPCVILEPFFIDKDSDLQIACQNFDKFKEEIINGIKTFKEKE